MDDLDAIYRYLDQIEGVLDHLRDVRSEEVDVGDIGDLCLVLSELHGWGTVYGADGPALSIHPAVLNRYVKFRGPFPTREARLVAERIRGFLRSLDHTTRPSVRFPQAVKPALPPDQPVLDHPAPWVIEAQGWRLIETSSELKAKIFALSSLLDNILERVQGSNYAPEHAALTELERNQLITILETALKLLKAPMAERGLLNTLKEMLGRTAKKAAEKKVEEGLGSAAQLAADRLGDLVNKIWLGGA